MTEIENTRHVGKSRTCKSDPIDVVRAAPGAVGSAAQALGNVGMNRLDQIGLYTIMVALANPKLRRLR